METVGEFFRQVRETKGLTLDEVASKTRIHPDFLKALEEGNYAKLPDQVFAKGFVRSYARSLGLDEEDAVRRFVDSAGTFYNKQTELERLRVQQEEDERRKKTNRKIVFGAVAVALLGLLLLLAKEQTVVVSKRPLAEPETFDLNRSRSASPPTRPLAAPKPVVPSSAPPVGSGGVTGSPGGRPTASPGPTPTQPVTRTGTEPPRPETARAAATTGAPDRTDPDGTLLAERIGAMVLDLEALELTWVVVQTDGGNPQEVLLRPGERVSYKADDKFILTLGNAGGVKVELDGKLQGPFGPSGSVIRDIVLKRG